MYTTYLTKSLFKTEDFYIALYNHEKDEIILEIDYDGSIKQRKRIIPLTKYQGLTAWIIKQKRPIIINDWDKEINAYPIVPVGNKTHKSYIGVPLMVENRIIGVLALQSPKKKLFQRTYS